MKMMIKAEIAREMIRSRTHTPNPARRIEELSAPVGGAETRVPAAGVGSVEFTGIRTYCIQNLPSRVELYGAVRIGRTSEVHALPDGFLRGLQ
jgi:hypothetical protein